MLFRLKRSKIRIILGDYDQFVTSESPAIMRAVSAIIRHRNFDSNTYNNDIALLKLRKPVTFSKTIAPVCVPSEGTVDPGGECVWFKWLLNVICFFFNSPYIWFDSLQQQQQQKKSFQAKPVWPSAGDARRRAVHCPTLSNTFRCPFSRWLSVAAWNTGHRGSHRIWYTDEYCMKNIQIDLISLCCKIHSCVLERGKRIRVRAIVEVRCWCRMATSSRLSVSMLGLMVAFSVHNL